MTSSPKSAGHTIWNPYPMKSFKSACNVLATVHMQRGAGATKTKTKSRSSMRRLRIKRMNRFVCLFLVVVRLLHCCTLWAHHSHPEHLAKIRITHTHTYIHMKAGEDSCNCLKMEKDDLRINQVILPTKDKIASSFLVCTIFHDDFPAAIRSPFIFSISIDDGVCNWATIKNAEMLYVRKMYIRQLF